jgi:hypothetical protein
VRQLDNHSWCPTEAPPPPNPPARFGETDADLDDDDVMGRAWR